MNIFKNAYVYGQIQVLLINSDDFELINSTKLVNNDQFASTYVLTPLDLFFNLHNGLVTFLIFIMTLFLYYSFLLHKICV